MANAFVCRVELSKTDGITVKLTDDKGKVTQSIVMDGKSITTTFKGKKKTSTITQKDLSVVIKVTGDKEPVRSPKMKKRSQLRLKTSQWMRKQSR